MKKRRKEKERSRNVNERKGRKYKINRKLDELRINGGRTWGNKNFLSIKIIRKN